MMLDFALRSGDEETIKEAVLRLKGRFENPLALLQRGFESKRVDILAQSLDDLARQAPELALLKARHHCFQAGDERCSPMSPRR